jgi:hypothetical protein
LRLRAFEERSIDQGRLRSNLMIGMAAMGSFAAITSIREIISSSCATHLLQLLSLYRTIFHHILVL